MNAFERFTNRLQGNPVDRPPNFDIFMTFAAHHIGQPLSRYYLDYHVLADANLAVCEDFDIDILQAISDPFREASDYGLKVSFPEDGLPVNTEPLIKEQADLAHLVIPPVGEGKRRTDRLEAVHLLRERSAGEIPVMGWVEGALAEAADLRGMGNLMVDLVTDPDWVIELVEKTCQGAIEFAQAQIRAGADIIGLGDAVCSQISPRMYRQFALPYEQRVFQAVKEMGAIPRLHICGNTTQILSDMVQSGAAIIDLDWMVDILSAAKRFGNAVSFCGNFDPVGVMFQGTPDQVYVAVRECVHAAGLRGFSAAGCEIPDGTPHANLHAQTRALNE